jgi:dTMP kinase
MAFIALEGGDGTGKTTQIQLLRERWGDLFPEKEAVFTKEPGGGSEFSRKIRELALNDEHAGAASPGAIFGLMLASRLEHLDSFVVPALLAGKAVVTDRFEAATWAYQIQGQEGNYLKPLYHAHREVVRDRLPEGYRVHVLILDLDPETAAERLRIRNEESNHFDRRDNSFHERVRAGLREYKSIIEPKAIFIDASGSMEAVHAAVVEQIRRILAS